MKPDLAVDGGVPVRSTMLPYGRQTIDESDVAAVVRVLQSDWLTTGPEVARFEAAFARRVGARFAVAVSSGTAGLHIAAIAAGFGPGDEVIVTPMTFAASANCVRYVGADVVFADVEAGSLLLDPARVSAALGPQTKGVIAVDYAGAPVDLDALRAITRSRSLVLIEDACHSLGAMYRGKTVGSLADMTVFSLHPVKHITTGEGGVVTTDDEALAAQLRTARNHGIDIDHRQRGEASSWFYDIRTLGFNYRLTDLQCALGLSQLEKLDRWLARRREIARRYEQAFAGFPLIELLKEPAGCESAWHLYVVQLNLDRLRVDRAQVFKALRAENIGVNVHYVPVPWHSYYSTRGCQKGSWPVAEGAYGRIVSLPMFPAMNDQDADDVVHAVRKVLGQYAV